MLLISWSTQSTFVDPDSGDLIPNHAEHILEFDVETSESHKSASVLTEHAVESGAPISDHKRKTPDTISIEATVTNTPLGAPPPSGYGPSDQVTATVQKSDSGAQVYVYSGTFDRMADVYETLRRLQLEATPVTLSTRIRTYDAVQITGVNTTRTPEDGDSLNLTIDIQEVRIAESRTTDTPRPREPRATRPTTRGAQEGTEVPATRQSTLEQLSDTLASWRAP